MKLPALFSRPRQAIARAAKSINGRLNGVSDKAGWITLAFESFMGAWQKDVVVNHESVLAQTTVFACTTLIASDISKMRLRLMETDEYGIRKETHNSSFSPVLAKPNHFQTTQQFIECWVISKYSRGNTYVLKFRDNRGVVIRLYVLDPLRMRPLVSPSGDIFYEAKTDLLSGINEDSVIIPAREIIHDRMNCLFHPLVGLSPIFACGLAATHALNIHTNAAKFFKNMSRPSGMLLGPGKISDETVKEVKDAWEKGFSGENLGRVAVLGDDLKYEPMSVDAENAQLVEQLELSAGLIASTYHVPKYMVGLETVPETANATQHYYSQCLQSPIEAIENCLDEGLGLTKVDGKTLRTEFDLDGLMRMDQAALVKMLSEGIKGSLMKPNEARRRANLSPLVGGDTIYMQQQNFSLAALNKRDNLPDPFAKGTSSNDPTPADEEAAAAKEFVSELLKRMECDYGN